MFFRQKSLTAIISTFDKVAADLTNHVDRKSQEHLELLAAKSDIEDQIDTTASEVDRTHRVLTKVQELVA
jgi:hypothetical protein